MIFSIVLKAANVRIVPRSCASPASRQDFQESIPSTSVPVGLFVASSLDAMLVTVHYVKEGIIDANVACLSLDDMQDLPVISVDGKSLSFAVREQYLYS
jgi:hypothetical protein